MVSKIYSKFATDAELLAASGKLQQEINQGGGGSGALIDETYLVHKTGSESISGIKRFLDGIFGFNFNTNSGTLSSSITGYTDEGVPLTGIPELCLDWQGRALYDRGGSPSIDWDFNVLYENGNISVDWESRELYNSAGDVTANWQSRELHAEDGVCINWGLRQLHAYNGDVVVNWDNKALYGTYVEDFVNIIPVETLAWASRQLLIGEANGFASLNWEGGVLMSTGTNSSGAASNHVVANWFEGILYAMRDSNEPEDGAETPFVAYPSVDWQNRKLSSFANLGSEEFPDWQSETALDWSGRLLYNVWGFVGGGLAAYGLPDEETGERPLFGYFFMSDGGMYFEDNNGSTLANINQRRLFGLNEGGFIETSLNWGNRTTSDDHGTQSIRWNTRELVGTYLVDDGEFGFYPEAIVTVNWSGRQLFDSGNAGIPTVSLDWQHKFMYNSEGNLSIDWEAGVLANSAGAPSVLYRFGQAYSVDGVMSIDWFSRDLRDLTGFSSLNWANRELLGDWIVNPILVENSPPVDAATPQGWVGVKIQGSGDIVFKMPVYL